MDLRDDCILIIYYSDTKDDDDLEEDLTLEDTDDGLMNVNVKERRQYLLEMLNNAPVIKPRYTNGTLDPKATMSRIGKSYSGHFPSFFNSRGKREFKS